MLPKKAESYSDPAAIKENLEDTANEGGQDPFQIDFHTDL